MKVNPDGTFKWPAIQKMRGKAYPRANRGQIILQKWPAKRGRFQSEVQKAWSDHFTCVANTYKDFQPHSYDFAKKYIKGSRWFVRDMMYAAANGDLIGIEGETKIITPTARVKRSSSEALTSGVQKTLTPNGRDWDNNQFWNSTTNPTRLTFKTAGLYIIYARVAFNAVTGSFRDTGIKLNGTTLLAIPRLWPSTANGLIGEAWDLWYFHAGDYIEFVAQANTTGVTATLQCGLTVGITPEAVIDESP